MDIESILELFQMIPKMAKEEPAMLALAAVLFLVVFAGLVVGIIFTIRRFVHLNQSAPSCGVDAKPSKKKKGTKGKMGQEPSMQEQVNEVSSNLDITTNDGDRTPSTVPGTDISGTTASRGISSGAPDDLALLNDVDELSKKRKKPGQKKQSTASKTKKYVNAKRSAKVVKNKAKPLKIPTSAQKTIPYEAVYEEDGIIEITPGVFTKSYALGDVNYQIARQEEQEDMFFRYGEALNAFDPSMRIQITFSQHNINMEEFEKEAMLPLKGDKLDDLRKERNSMLKKKILEGRNNLVVDKYLTVSVQADSFENAQTTFARLDNEISTNINKIGGATATPLNTVQRLEILHDIYNLGSEGMFGNNYVRVGEKKVNGTYVPIYNFAEEKFRFDIMQRMGLTTKDMIAPESFTFKSDHGMIGDKYFRALFIRTLPTFLGDSVLSQLTNTDCNLLTSVIYEPVETEHAVKMAKNQITNINTSLVDKQKQASKSGYSTELINPELKDAAEEANALLKDLTGKNQKLFMMTLVIVHFADTKEQLDTDTAAIKAIGRRQVLDIKPLSWQQENGLASALPLCNNKLHIKRSLTTEAAAILMPFVNQELNEKHGMYYGNNAVSHNLIRFDRRNLKNGNGFIFGSPGSGKSMTAKQEMLTVRLSSDDVVIVIDPDGEYGPMAEMLDGEVVRIAAGADVHINPFDINLVNYDSTDDPLAIKSDFIVSLCENSIGGNIGLSPAQHSIIDRCVRKVYEPFISSRDPETGEYDKELLPTLKDFYNSLRDEHGWDAMNLADSLELYAVGSQDVFAYKTNVEYSKRFVVYDIKDIGETMKSMGLLVVLDNIWNRIVAGRAEGRNVWFFIDEIYLLFKSPNSAEFLRNLYKRARKYGGIPTGITQNVSDILNNEIARTMIMNSEHVVMLNQSAPDCAQLMDLLNISPSQANYITKAAPGEGLIFNGSVIVPFVNRLPKDTKQYEAMTTKLSEVKAREDRKRAEEEALRASSQPMVIIPSDDDEMEEEEFHLYVPEMPPEESPELESEPLMKSSDDKSIV